MPGTSHLCILIDLKDSRAGDGSGVCTVIDFVSTPWTVIVSFQIQPSWLKQVLIRKLDKKVGIRLVSYPKRIYCYILLEADSSLISCRYSETCQICPFQWYMNLKFIGRLQLGFSRLWVDPGLGGCYWPVKPLNGLSVFAWKGLLYDTLLFSFVRGGNSVS